MKYIIIFTTLIAACSSHADISVSPDGKRMVLADCEWSGPTNCYRQVGDACPKGYTILKDHFTSLIAECK